MELKFTHECPNCKGKFYELNKTPECAKCKILAEPVKEKHDNSSVPLSDGLASKIIEETKEMSEKCEKCFFVEKFVSETDSSTVLNICTAEEPEEEFEGSQRYLEVSEFNSEDCLYFKDAG